MTSSSENFKIVDADKRANIPECLYWDVDRVCEWVEEIGLPLYKECFRSNFINGRKLIAVHASSLPRMGVTKLEDILFITKKVRKLLGTESAGTSQFSTQQDPKVMYYEQKKKTGRKVNNLTYPVFMKKNSMLFK